MNYYIYGYTDVGSYRENNEDAVLVDHQVLNSGSAEAAVSAPFIAAVCDGVGEKMQVSLRQSCVFSTFLYLNILRLRI